MSTPEETQAAETEAGATAAGAGNQPGAASEINAEWQLSDLVDSIAAEIDHAEDTLALKSYARGIAFAIKQLNLELAVTVRRDGAGRLLFRTVDPSQPSATIIKLDFAQMLQSQLQGLRRPLDRPADTRPLSALPQITSAAIIRLNAIGIYSIDDLERYTQTAAMLAEVSRKTDVPEPDLRRWRGLPYLSRVLTPVGAPGATIVIEGGHLGIAPDPTTTVLFHGQVATIVEWSPSRVTVTLPRVGGEGVLFAIIDGQTTNQLVWSAATIDLAVRAITLEPAAPLADEPVTVVATLVNQGTGPTGPFQVRWAIDGQPEAVQMHGPLGPGEVSGESSSRRIMRLPAGPHQITLTADPERQLPDSLPENSSLTVSVTARRPLDLIIGDLRHPSSLDPLQRRADATDARLAVPADALRLLFRGLLRLDVATRQGIPDLADGPGIVETTGSGTTTLTVRLRPNLRFHDGTPVTAKDVVFSYSTAQATPEPWGRTLAQAFRQITASDARTIVFVSTRDIRQLQPVVWTVPIVPEAAYASAEGEFGRRPIGAGPFRLERWTETELILRAAPHVQPQPARLDRIIIRLYGAGDNDPTELIKALLAGELDAAALPATGPVAELAERLARSGEWRVIALSPNESPYPYHFQSPNLFEREPNAVDTAGNASLWYVLTAVTVRPPVLDPAQVIGGWAVQGVVPLTGPAPAGTVITLTSSDAAARFANDAASQTIEVASGARRIPFALTTRPVMADQTVAIAARLADGPVETTMLRVLAARVVSLAVDSSAVAVGRTVTLTVRLSAAVPQGAALVRLSLTTIQRFSEVPVVTIVSDITIAPDSTTGTATLAAYASGVVRIGVTVGTVDSDQSVVLTVHPAVQSLTFDRSQTIVGQSVTATVTLGGPAPDGGTSLAVTSSFPGIAQPVSASLLVPSGQTAVAVGISALQPGSAQLTATAFGSSARDGLVVVPRLATLVLTPARVGPPQLVRCTVRLDAAAPRDLIIHLATSNGVLALFEDDQLRIVAGQTEGQATLKTAATSIGQSVRISATLHGYQSSPSPGTFVEARLTFIRTIEDPGGNL